MIDIHEAIKTRENQISALQTQIAAVNEEIKALRVAARILEAGNGSVVKEVTTTNNSTGGEKTRAWP